MQNLPFTIYRLSLLNHQPYQVMANGKWLMANISRGSI